MSGLDGRYAGKSVSGIRWLSRLAGSSPFTSTAAVADKEIDRRLGLDSQRGYKNRRARSTASTTRAPISKRTVAAGSATASTACNDGYPLDSARHVEGSSAYSRSAVALCDGPPNFGPVRM